MRSVKTARISRSDGRRRAGGTVRRKPRDSVRATFGKRRHNDRLSLLLARVRGWFEFGRPMLWLTGALLVSVLIAGAFAGGHVGRAIAGMKAAADTVVADAGFGISAVRLSGNHRTQPDEILAALGFAPGESIFAVDVAKARKQLMALPWVFDADVRRQYPDSVSVNIIERRPFALWQRPGGLYVVDRSGRTIALASEAQFRHLPLLAGDGAPGVAADLVDAVAMHRAVSARVKGMVRISERRWNLLLDGDVVVELPEDGWVHQLDVLEHLIVDRGVLERDISEIDLRARDNYFFVLRNGQKQTPRGNAA